MYSYLSKSISQLRSVTCHDIGSHSVTCYSTQVNAPRLHRSQTGWYSIYRPFEDGGLSKPRPRVQRATGPQLLRDSPGQRDPNPRSIDHYSSMLTTRLSATPVLGTGSRVAAHYPVTRSGLS